MKFARALRGRNQCVTVFSPVQAVLDNELGAFYRSLIQSPPVDDEPFNWEEVSKIGIRSRFLDSPHTLKYYRTQHTQNVFQRAGRDDYEKVGRAGAFEAARDKAIALINSPLPDCLPNEDQVWEIEKVVEAADIDIIDKAQGHTGKRKVI